MSKAYQAFKETNTVLTVEQLQKFTKAEQEQVRQLCMRDTWFFAQRIMRASHSLPLQPCHQQFCDALFQPSPVLPLADWDLSIKERCLLCFRNFGKSTINRAHIIQSILCYPDIRILLVSGVVAHAVRELDAIVGLLNYTPVLDVLFPQFTNASVKQSAFTTLARTQLTKEATITCSSFRSTMAGGHYDYISCDDAQNESTTGSDKMLDKGMDSYDSLFPLLEPSGYINYIGCRQHPKDIPSQMQQRCLDIGTPLGGCEIPVMQLREGADVLARYENGTLDLTKDVESYAWEARWNAATLRLPYTKPNFKSQYMLDVELPEQEPVPEALTPDIIKKCATSEPIDVMRQVPVLNGDLATVGNAGSDCCCVIAGYWDIETQRLTITGLINKKFTDKEDFLLQVQNLYDTQRTYNEIHFRIEQVNQTKELWEEDFERLKMPVYFERPSVERWKRIDNVFKAIRANNIRFHSSLTQNPISIDAWHELIYQCCNSQLEHDDAIDSLSQLWLFVQSITAVKPASASSLNLTFDDEPINPHPARPCNTVKIRRPDTTQQPPVPYADDYYRRLFSTGYER